MKNPRKQQALALFGAAFSSAWADKEPSAQYKNLRHEDAEEALRQVSLGCVIRAVCLAVLFVGTLLLHLVVLNIAEEKLGNYFLGFFYILAVQIVFLICETQVWEGSLDHGGIANMFRCRGVYNLCSHWKVLRKQVTPELVEEVSRLMPNGTNRANRMKIRRNAIIAVLKRIATRLEEADQRDDVRGKQVAREEFDGLHGFATECRVNVPANWTYYHPGSRRYANFHVVAVYKTF